MKSISTCIYYALFTFPTIFAIFGRNDLNYNETEARIVFDFAAAASAEDPNLCLQNVYNSSTHKARILTEIKESCDVLGSKCIGFVAATDSLKLITVSFRGTKTMTQFFSESISFLLPYQLIHNRGSVNYYFFKAMNTMWPKIESILHSPEFKDYDVIFTGHSLGGAMASLSAFRTIVMGLRSSNQVKVITFGEPRVGDLEFATYFDALVKYSFRVVNSADVIIHIPPCHKDYRYLPSSILPCDNKDYTSAYHHMTEVWYPDGMSEGSPYIVCDGLPRGEEHSCSNSLVFQFENISKALTDHRKYFNFMVSQYGRAGCDRNREYDESEGAMGLLKNIFAFLSKYL